MYRVLSLFPELFIVSFFAPTLLRIASGLILIYSGYSGNKSLAGKEGVKKWLNIIKIVVSIFLIIGLYTQGAAILLSLILIGELAQERKSGEKSSLLLKILLIAVQISILVLGPGAIAIDMSL